MRIEQLKIMKFGNLKNEKCDVAIMSDNDLK